MGFLETKKMTSATAKTVKVFDGLLIWQGRFLGLKLYWRPKFQTQCSFLLRDERLEFSSRSRPIRSSTGRIHINNANRFICDNIFRSLSMTGANTWQEAREGTPLVALNWLERRYEIYTSKSLGRERSKSWAKSVVSNFRRSLRVASPRIFARACVFCPPHNRHRQN